MKNGFSEQEALDIKWLSKDMHKNKDYMNDFKKIFNPLDRWGPGSKNDTLKALSYLPKNISKILELGCGKGLSTFILAQNTDAEIIAIDNDKLAIDYLIEKVVNSNINEQIKPTVASMMNLPFKKSRFDVIWAEGSLYIMGIKKALNYFNSFLIKSGYIVFSDLVWVVDNPTKKNKDFWEIEYPDMKNIPSIKEIINETGFELITDFNLGNESWNNYINPLKDNITRLKEKLKNSDAIKQIEYELNIYNEFLNKEMEYHFFVAVKIN